MLKWQVKELENGLIQLLETSDECLHFSSAIQSIGNVYEPGPQVSFSECSSIFIFSLNARLHELLFFVI